MIQLNNHIKFKIKLVTLKTKYRVIQFLLNESSVIILYPK
jgi:hypothetical protein